MNKMDSISVIIPAHNEEKHIGGCLESLFSQSCTNLVEVIVVDNASTDKTASIARQFKNVRVVAEPKKGVSLARQRGFLEAKGDILAFIDADTIAPDGWFATIEKEFSDSRELVCLSGPCHYFDLPRWHHKIVRLYWSAAVPLYSFVSYMAIAGNFIARKEALKKIGGFDTSIAFYGDDTDAARRLAKVGKVKFLKDFYIYTSGRRLSQEGIIKIGIIYAANFFWVILFRKPLTKKYKDIRV